MDDWNNDYDNYGEDDLDGWDLGGNDTQPPPPKTKPSTFAPKVQAPEHRSGRGGFGKPDPKAAALSKPRPCTKHPNFHPASFMLSPTQGTSSHNKNQAQFDTNRQVCQSEESIDSYLADSSQPSLPCMKPAKDQEATKPKRNPFAKNAALSNLASNQPVASAKEMPHQKTSTIHRCVSSRATAKQAEDSKPEFTLEQLQQSNPNVSKAFLEKLMQGAVKGTKDKEEAIFGSKLVRAKA